MRLRSSALPVAQAAVTTLAATLGVVLVTLWRPHRARQLPFYSDASHHDPERIVLSLCENLAFLLTVLAAIAEHAYLRRLCVRLIRLIRPVRPVGPDRLVKANLAVALLGAAALLVTANVPSRFPATRLHQIAASSLIVAYAAQASLRLRLAALFRDVRAAEAAARKDKHSSCMRWWQSHHMKVRRAIAVALWGVLLGTWMTFVVRVAVKYFRVTHSNRIRVAMAMFMAALVHVATVACVVLMIVLAIDLRHEYVYIYSTDGAMDEEENRMSTPA